MAAERRKEGNEVGDVRRSEPARRPVVVAAAAAPEAIGQRGGASCVEERRAVGDADERGHLEHSPGADVDRRVVREAAAGVARHAAGGPCEEVAAAHCGHEATLW